MIKKFLPHIIFLIIPLIVFSFFIVGNAKAATGVWQSCETGTLTCDINWNWSMGYKFTPTQNGQITQLCGYFSGTKTVKLYSSSYDVLASVSVTSSNNWSCSSITPINVIASQTYYVVVELADSLGCYRTFSSPFPMTCQTVTIGPTVYQSPAGTFNGNHLEYSLQMYGIADVVFVPTVISYTLTVAKSGTGSGIVTSNPAGINCGTDCTENYTSDTSVTLTAAPASGSTFAGWSGVCSGTGTCTLTMNGNKSATANFNLIISPGLNNVSGWAWSENIGWVKFNGTNYGVNINPATGNFSGYAWSENIGWIDFAPAGPYPVFSGSPNYSACLDSPGNGQACDGIGNYKAGGWARALSYGSGWDGWIKLRGANYGVSVDKNTGKLSGYAWSDMVIGWISFSGSNYGAVTTLAFNSPPNKPGTPSAYLPDGVGWDNCSFAGESLQTFHWTYSDPDGDPQAAYEVEVDDNSSFTAPKFNHLVNLVVPSPSDVSYVLDLDQDDTSPKDWISQLAWDTNYSWRAMVKDSKGNGSQWSNPIGFKTPKHAYPYPNFTWLPAGPTQGETVTFNSDSSTVYGGAVISSYFWSVTQGTGSFVGGTNANSRYPKIQFSTLNNKVKLQVTDSDGYSCGAGAGEGEKSITAELPLPEYKEVPPSSWLKRIFAGIGAFIF